AARSGARQPPAGRAWTPVAPAAPAPACGPPPARGTRETGAQTGSSRSALPIPGFTRHKGVYAGFRFTPAGELIDEATWTHRHTEWLPTQSDREYVKSCMHAVHERGKFANYIAPPAQGANNQPPDFEYVKFN